MEERGQEGEGGKLHNDGDGGWLGRGVRCAREVELVNKVVCNRSVEYIEQWGGCFVTRAETGMKRFLHLAEPICSHA